MSKTFLNGLIVLVPVGITLFVVMQILNFTEGVLGKHLPFHFPGIGLIAVLLFIYIVGWVSTHWLLKHVISFGESLLGKIPVVKFIYNSVKQFSTAIFESNSMFQNVVLVPFHQSLAMGFLMPNVPAVIKEKLDEDYVCVFVPWSLNITSGTNLFVKRSEVIPIDIKSDAALQFMLTAGNADLKDKGQGARDK